MTRRKALALAGLLGLAAAALPYVVDYRANRSGRAKPAGEAARVLHGKLLIADMHADSLLWARDPNRRHSRGHVDLPRLREGNVAIQVFDVVTDAPIGMNIHRTPRRPNMIFALAALQGWPPSTWRSRLALALHQASRLASARAESGGKLAFVRSASELREALARRKKEPDLVAAVLGLEGLHAAEGRLENVDRLFEAGFRVMAPVHFFDNELGGSAHGVGKGGLTPFGRRVIGRLEELGVVLDLAHGSPALIDDALAMSKRPVLVSHAGVRGTCDNPRNLSDEQLRAVAKGGGLVGIGFWPTAVCGRDAAAVAKALRHAANVAGIDHVALGSDFDGAVSAPFDASGLPSLTEALVSAGFTETEVRKVMGGNAERFLLAVLPP